ncbi:MAG TPA: hypothetical protein VFE47_08675, partial [Tepidisphaeraceae bacterium]|nr:hypothetical protein [Tepidisphaeraceae bacterium]
VFRRPFFIVRLIYLQIDGPTAIHIESDPRGGLQSLKAGIGCKRSPRGDGRVRVEGGYFRVDGADLETGEESHLLLQAATLAEAETVARSQGLLISAVRKASPADWGASANAGAARPRTAEAVITFEPRSQSHSHSTDPAPAAPGKLNGHSRETSPPNVANLGNDIANTSPELILLDEPATAPKATEVSDTDRAATAGPPESAAAEPIPSTQPSETKSSPEPQAAPIETKSAAEQTAATRQSVFADVRLSPDVTAWAADRPAEPRPLPKNLSPRPSAAAPPTGAEPAALSGTIRDSRVEPIASVAIPGSADASAETDLQTVLVGAGEETAFDAASASAGSAVAAKEKPKPPAAPKVVPVKATPVLVPKMGLAANLRRIAPGTGGGIPPRFDPAKAIPATSTPITPPAATDAPPGAAAPEKPPTPIRATAATVQSRRFGRSAPIVPIRRTLQPAAAPPAPAQKSQTPVADVQALPTPAPTSAETPSPAEVEVIRPVAQRVDASGLDQLFANLAGEQSAKPAEPVVEELRPEPIIAEAVVPVVELSAKPAAAIESAPVGLDLADELPAVTEPAVPLAAEPAPALKLAAQAAVAVQTKATALKPPAKRAAGVRRPMPALVVLTLGSVAALLTLGGIALIVVSLVSPIPTAAAALDKLDFHIQMLMLTVVGGLAALAGLLIFLVATVIHFGQTIKLQTPKQPRVLRNIAGSALSSENSVSTSRG